MPEVPGDADRPAPARSFTEISVPDVRDYHRVNAELIQQLDAGHARVRLVGVEGQRLLASGLSGNWDAVVEIEGKAGPELAAGMNAPNLTVVCRGSAADGAGSSLVSGRLLVCGEVGAAAGYAQKGGTIVVAGDAGPRAGLNQSGGVLILQGRVAPLAAERQSGGTVFVVFPGFLEGHAGRNRRGGRLILSAPVADQEITPSDSVALVELSAILSTYEEWLPKRGEMVSLE